MHKLRTLSLTVAVALLACALVPTAAFAAISRETVMARGRVWLNAVRVDPKTKKTTIGVPYDQGKWAFEDGSVSPKWVGYRTDCSGFASLCWNLRTASGAAYSTSTYEMGKNNSPYFKLTPIGKSELQPGDLLLRSTVWYSGSGGHAIIFAGWSKADMSEYWALEQTTPGTKYSRRPYGQAGYRSFRYNGIEGFNRTRVTYGGSFTVEGTVYRTPDASGSVVATSGAVDLALVGSDGALSPIATNVPVDANGRYSMTHTPTRTGRFTVLYRNADTVNQTTVLPATTVTVAPGVSAVGGYGSKIGRKKNYTFTGTVNPRVGAELKIYKYNKKARKYLPYKVRKASVSSRKSAGRYKLTAKWKPTVKGQYRLNWLTASPAGMTYSSSGYRYVTVK